MNFEKHLVPTARVGLLVGQVTHMRCFVVIYSKGSV
jgi:hypothetical protein